jgi:hypothetical protein
VVSVKRAPLVVGFGVIVGCASILDIPELEAPPPAAPENDSGFEAAVDAGAEAEAEAACGSSPGVSTLTKTPRSVHTAIDETDVYFTRADPPRDSAILKCSKCGCEKPTELVKLNQPGAIAVDDRYVFWTDNQEAGSLNRLLKSDPSKIQQITLQENPIGVAVDAQYVYWTVIGGGPQGIATAGVYRAKKDDLSEVTRLTKSADLPADVVPYAISVDATHVYYTTAPDLDDQNPETPCKAAFGTIRRVEKTGGALQTSAVIAMSQPCPVGLALGNDTIYWVNLGVGALAGSVMSKPKAEDVTVMPTPLAGNLGRPTSLAFHAGRLAWNVPANQRIESCTATACSDLETLASDQRNPSGLSADRSGIYWAVLGTVNENFTDGALRRIALP